MKHLIIISQLLIIFTMISCGNRNTGLPSDYYFNLWNNRGYL